MSGVPKDITGQRFGRLIAIEKTDKRYQTSFIWRCLCDCGNYTKVRIANLSNHTTKSCGCLKKEINIKKMTTHGMSRTRQYITWKNMRKRCEDENGIYYHLYGGRGIKVCEQWLKFENFWEDMKKGYSNELTIERINNNGNYEPSNCRWATRKEQNMNQRIRKDARIITYKEQNKTLSQWANEYGINQDTLWARVSRYGWNIERAFNQPVINLS